MNTQLQKAKDTLYGVGGLGASDFKMFPGSNREITAEEIAEQLNAAFEDILAGNVEFIDCPTED